ncbi:MAG TPA: mycofactocin biosynthesis peptidyl-dipeptidase MftE [Mycobacteriales bacterium]|nr:mycofactocin biosynthesis peptidyl-dipeptidase MftE [Mycobacteriales bacterium]
MRLADLSWPQVPLDALLAVPVGSTEQHGPHLPLSTDTDIAGALCDRLAARRPGVLVAPPVPYGSSGEHAAFPGTLSIGQAALELVLVELIRGAHQRRVLIVNGHGGNAAPLTRAVATLRSEGRDVLAWSPTVRGGDAHAGRTETSLQLALDPGRVRMPATAAGNPAKLASAAGNPAPLASLMPALAEGRLRELSPSGVLGDVSGASAAVGNELLTTLLTDLQRCVAERWPT